MFSSKRDRSRSLSPSSFLSALIEEEDADQKKTGFPVPNKRRKLLPSSSSPPETVAADTSIPPAGAATTITAAAAHRENDKDNDKDKGEREKSERIKSEKGKEKQKDLLSPLSDEILLRILAFLSPPGLLALAPVSHRFYALTCDSQLWKGLYYDSFVRPRALRIPGFRNGVGSSTTTTATTSSIKTSSTTTAAATTIPGTAGFKAGGGVTTTTGFGFGFGGGESFAGGFARGTTNGNEGQTIDWKKQYKVRHKWAWGRCTAWSLNLGDKDEDEKEDQEEEDEEGKVEGENRGKVKRRTLIKIAGTTVITADAGKGLCAWDSSNVREGELLARVDLGREGAGTVPSCISVDQTVGPDKEVVVDIALGFTDGGFGIWRLFTRNKKLVRRYRHEGSSTNAELAEVAYSHPFLVTATGSVLVSLYTFDVPKPGEEEVGQKVKGTGILAEYADSDDEDGQDDPNQDDGRGELPPPYLLTSLRSHTSRPPLALSIRKTVFTTIASIAYTFSTLQGWAIGVQDLHIRKGTRSTKSLPEVITSRIAYTTPMASGRASHPRLATPPPTPRRQESLAGEGSTGGGSSKSTEPGPTCLRYTHPYLLATLPDNTLILYMCTSNATSLSISPGIRLWGHTSGISDAQITRRGKVVSVSSRGGEMRAWELEGASRYGSRRSVEIRPELPPAQGNSGTLVAGATTHHEDAGDVVGFDEWKKSVGFTDEMLIVLDERNSRGRATMMVYDFR